MVEWENYCGEIGDVCKDLQKQDARIEELEAENRRLREALKEIEDFANENYEKRFPYPSCVTFETIKLRAEKALKGSEQ